jgi:transposase
VIKDLHRQGLSNTEISGRTGHARKIIRRVINAPLQRERQPGRRTARVRVTDSGAETHDVAIRVTEPD